MPMKDNQSISFKYGINSATALFGFILLTTLSGGMLYAAIVNERPYNIGGLIVKSELINIFLFVAAGLTGSLVLKVLFALILSRSDRQITLFDNRITAPVSTFSNKTRILFFNAIKSAEIQKNQGKRHLKLKHARGDLMIPEVAMDSESDFLRLCELAAKRISAARNQSASPPASGLAGSHQTPHSRSIHNPAANQYNPRAYGKSKKELLEAASFFNDTVKKLLTIDGTLHAETLVSSIARMCGSLLFRSFEFEGDLEPGMTVLSEQANVEGPKLVNLVFRTLQSLGQTVSDDTLDQNYLSSEYSHLSFKQVHDRLAVFFLRYCETADLTLKEGATAAAIASALIAHECREVLAIEKGAALAVFGLVEGTKTAPFPVRKQ